MSQSKPRVIKDFEKLEESLQEQIKLQYPSGFSEHLIRFANKDGVYVSALPFETEDRYYLVRMTIAQAKSIIEEDTDYDDDGNLKDDIKEEYEDRHNDLDTMSISSNDEKEDEDEDYD